MGNEKCERIRSVQRLIEAATTAEQCDETERYLRNTESDIPAAEVRTLHRELEKKREKLAKLGAGE